MPIFQLPLKFCAGRTRDSSMKPGISAHDFHEIAVFNRGAVLRGSMGITN
jgi:hypothetical protein